MSYFKGLYKITHDINTKVLGENIEDVIYTPQGGAGFDIQGIFHNNFEAVDASSEIVISANVCLFFCHLSHFETQGVVPINGDTIEISEIDYRVTDSQEDGQGGVKLVLHKK